MSENRNSKYQISLPIVLCFGLAAGVFVGSSFSSRKSTAEVGSDVQKLREVLTKVHDEYVDTVNTRNLVDEAITEMLHKLDPHSSYIPAQDRIAANEDLRGNFDGIGVEFNSITCSAGNSVSYISRRGNSHSSIIRTYQI